MSGTNETNEARAQTKMAKYLAKCQRRVSTLWIYSPVNSGQPFYVLASPDCNDTNGIPQYFGENLAEGQGGPVACLAKY